MGQIKAVVAWAVVGVKKQNFPGLEIGKTLERARFKWVALKGFGLFFFLGLWGILYGFPVYLDRLGEGFTTFFFFFSGSRGGAAVTSKGKTD